MCFNLITRVNLTFPWRWNKERIQGTRSASSVELVRLSLKTGRHLIFFEFLGDDTDSFFFSTGIAWLSSVRAERRKVKSTKRTKPILLIILIRLLTIVKGRYGPTPNRHGLYGKGQACVTFKITKKSEDEDPSYNQTSSSFRLFSATRKYEAGTASNHRKPPYGE